MPRSLIGLFIAATAGVALPGAQQATFHGGTHTVSVYATVVDRAGRIVPNLTQDDFSVFDNGKRQPLTVFKNDAQPITIVIMLDRSGSMVGNFAIERAAAERFVDRLVPGDRARLGSFSTAIQIDPEDFTSDRAALARILRDRLQGPGSTPLWNAADAAMNALVNQDGRRVVLIFTDGYDSPLLPDGNVTQAQVIARAQRDEIMMYAIGLANGCDDDPPTGVPSQSSRFQRGGGRPPGGRGPGAGGPRIPGGGRFPGGIGGRVPIPTSPPIGRGPIPGRPPDVPIGPGGIPAGGIGREPVSRLTGTGCPATRPDPGLRQIAEEGGGAYFELRRHDDLAATFARVADELHQQYLLAFTADSMDGTLHRLDVRLRDPKLIPRARKSYLAPTRSEQ